ncbi:PDZ domain-containing protein [Neobacillus niacini]|uniref:PDZ domain-containing protein n=1 Tax=Neobacillus niacini TaxID=86668 RepID=UPI00398347E7
MELWLLELLKGTGRLFLNPVFYYLIFLSGILGVLRVKRERKNFHNRTFDAYFELRQLFPIGLLLGLILTIVTLMAGLTLPFAAILLIAVFTLVWSLTGNIRLMSPVYTVGAAFFAINLIIEYEWTLPFFNDTFQALDEKVYPGLVILMALLLISEGILISKNAIKGTSPKLVRSRRGQLVGAHEVKRFWIVPMFLLIPGEVLTLNFDWWPVFTIGAESYSLVLVPFAIGINQQIQGMLPKESILLQGRRVTTFGILIMILSVVGYWYPLISIGTAAVAIIGRELISLMQRLKDDNLPFYFSKKNNGLMIIGIIPQSPADKMGLQVGELISKVNGVAIRNEHIFYEGLQKNRAHCKLEVLDINGEVRFVQRALYEGDHYELGILFVQEQRKFDERIG